MKGDTLMMLVVVALTAGSSASAAPNFPIKGPGGGGPIQKIITGSNGSDARDGTSLNERFDMLAGFDDVRAGAGDDDIFGGPDDDRLNGEDGIDEIFGDQGIDDVSGGDGNDRIDGGRGNDNLFGGDGNDFVRGNDEKDELFGEDGNDTLWGGFGDDDLHGGPGVDILRGDDPLVNSADEGRDKFFFDEGWSVPGAVDEIRDLNRKGIKDAINLEAYDANAGKDGTQAFKRIANNASSLKAGELTVVKVGKDVIVRGNTDSDKALELEFRIVGFTGVLNDIEFEL